MPSCAFCPARSFILLGWRNMRHPSYYDKSKSFLHELFAHELSHVFLNSAGYGQFDTSPINGDLALAMIYTHISSNPNTDDTTCTSPLSNKLSCPAFKYLGDSPSALRYTTNPNESGNEAGGTAPNEVMTNFIQNMALERLSINSIPTNPAEYRPRFNRALSNNLLRHANPADVLAAIDSNANINSRTLTSVLDSIVIRFAPNNNSRSMQRKLAGQSQ
jgi:hypothetical protein